MSWKIRITKTGEIRDIRFFLTKEEAQTWAYSNIVPEQGRVEIIEEASGEAWPLLSAMAAAMAVPERKWFQLEVDPTGKNWREDCAAAGLHGPWDNEPDREEWRHAGLPCLARRGFSGAWCGYVAVPPGHPLHGKAWDELDELDGVPSHGGITYASACSGDIRHVRHEVAVDQREDHCREAEAQARAAKDALRVPSVA